MHDHRPELPLGAGQNTDLGFEPDDDWLRAANPELRQEAMRLWFLTRYEDPANNTPYMGSEGGYLYIHGGPFNAEEELGARFGHVCSEEAINAVINDVEAEGNFEWAPIHHSDYDTQLQYVPIAHGSAYRWFLQRLKEADELAALRADRQCREMLRQLLYVSLIVALARILHE